MRSYWMLFSPLIALLLAACLPATGAILEAYEDFQVAQATGTAAAIQLEEARQDALRRQAEIQAQLEQAQAEVEQEMEAEWGRLGLGLVVVVMGVLTILMLAGALHQWWYEQQRTEQQARGPASSVPTTPLSDR